MCVKFFYEREVPMFVKIISSPYDIVMTQAAVSIALGKSTTCNDLTQRQPVFCVRGGHDMDIPTLEQSGIVVEKVSD